MKKQNQTKPKRGLKSNALTFIIKVLIAILLLSVFGISAFTDMFFKTFVLSINNVISLVFTIYWLKKLFSKYEFTKKEEQRAIFVKNFLTILIFSAFVLSIFGFDLYSFIWHNLLLAPAIWIINSFGVFFLILIIAIIVVLTVFLLIKTLVKNSKAGPMPTNTLKNKVSHHQKNNSLKKD